MVPLEGKRVVVVGLGASGVAAARLCASRGAKVVANDRKPLEAWGPEARALEQAGVKLVAGGHERAGLSSADLVVVSPGVPPFPELEAADRAGVRIWGEVELATRLLRHPAPIVAVGGTNGKSTTTSLVGALLEAQELQTFTGGNLGEPLASHADERFEAIVLEVSSFQMERVDEFHPRSSILLNITEDHLDRYPDLAAYARAKGNSFARQTPEDVAVVPVGDDLCHLQAQRGRGRIVTFGPGGDFDVTPDAIVDRARSEYYARSELALVGGHNASNAAAALAAVTPFGVEPDAVRRVFQTFRGLPHRMALVAEIDGVRYYDDSKGTNVGAVVTALEGLAEAKAVLIAGGRDKEGSYTPLVQALRTKGRAAVLIGEAAERIAHAIGDAIPVHHAKTLDEAVRASAKLAYPGDAVLLSPACSSYDMFRDYKHRGDEFVRSVKLLEGVS
ncbi:MAG TPA: UDP-N-acetylmuramoyl-L-alanine--D-glutamate ligase [Polyangiaceae bacterium]|jgi:UDP-N-acetylmuramoylalanine--D-glutamate ligase